MVIHLSGADRSTKKDYFEQIFRLRHQVFINGRGWSLPSSDGLEIDQYDTRETVYFADINEEGALEGSVRLSPTIRSSLLADYFPHLIEGNDDPRGSDIYEATRYIVLPVRKSRDRNRAAKARLLAAMLEWALENNLSYIQTVIDTATLPSFVDMTAATIPLGLSHPYGGGRGVPGGGECMAIRWPITTQVLQDIREYGGLASPDVPLQAA